MASRITLVVSAAVCHSVSAAIQMLPGHPRLLANDTVVAQLRNEIVTNPSSELGVYYSGLLASGISAVASPLTPYPNCTVVGSCRNKAVFGSNASYINTGHIADTIITCALLHRLGINASTQWATRAIAELTYLSSPAFPSWYWPVGQALERSATAFAVAVGYDWLYDVLSPAQRSQIEDAIGTLVLQTRLQDERQGMWWTQDPLNWNINSNGPLLAAALAIADVPSWSTAAQDVISTVLADIPTAIASWAPYGIWPEGPGYSSFTMGSQVQAAASMLSATGDDAGLMAAPGVCGVGAANIYHTGPSGTLFNWADGHPSAPATPALFYTSAVCNRPEYAVFARALNSLSAVGHQRTRAAGHRTQASYVIPKTDAHREPIYTVAGAAVADPSVAPLTVPGGSTGALDMLWYSSMGAWSDLAALPTAAVFADPSTDTLRGRKTHYGSFRSCWAFGSAGAAEGNCTSSVWVAFKGGQNHFDDHGSQSHNNHGHLDVGNFVLESGPERYRWAVDLGPDAYDYPLLAYFGRFRFGYYYLSSYGHNVIRFDNDSQHRRGSGAIVASNVSSQTGPWATIDTSTAHGGAVYSLRTVSQTSTTPFAVTVTDAWLHPTATNVTWVMHTAAHVQINGATATLTSPSGKSSILLSITAGSAAVTAGSAPCGVDSESATQLVGCLHPEAAAAVEAIVKEKSKGRLATARSAPTAVDVAWQVSVLSKLPPQATTYQDPASGQEVPVYVLTATVPASAGAIGVTFVPLN